MASMPMVTEPESTPKLPRQMTMVMVTEEGNCTPGERSTLTHVGSNAANQATQGMIVKEPDMHALHMAENIAAQIEHDFLASPLHQVGLDEFKKIGGDQRNEVNQGQARDAMDGIGREMPGEQV